MISPAGSVAEARLGLDGIASELQAVESWLAAEFRGGPAPLAPLLAHAGRFRGKRLRAAQLLLVGRACGRLTPEHQILAGVVELIHAATLAHDDVLDGATRRRDLDCLHVEWGSAAAVLLGDWLYARAFAHCTALPDRTPSQVLAEATARICAGEIHQNLTRGRFDLGEEEYFAQVDGKTGALFEAAGRLGAHAAGAPPRAVEAAARHGLLAGRAFQVEDDLLDLCGDARAAGKSLGTDWERRKMTLPLIRLRDLAGPAERAALERAFAGDAPGNAWREGALAKPFAAASAACREEVQRCLAEAVAMSAQLPDLAGRDALARLTLGYGNRGR